MTGVSTKLIKDSIRSWLNTGEFRKKIDGFYGDTNISEGLGIHMSSSKEQQYDKMHAILCSGYRWSRISKETVDDDFEFDDQIFNNDDVISFGDMVGWVNPDYEKILEGKKREDIRTQKRNASR